MLHLNVNRILRLKGITYPFRFLTNLGLNSVKASAMMKNKRKLISISDLETLCYHLWCSPNDLFEWEADKQHPEQAGHPLNVIRRTNEELDLAKSVRELSMEQIREVNRFAAEMKEKGGQQG